MATDQKPVRLPEVGEYVRQCGTLVEVQDVTPKEIILDYIFEETSARLEGRINGKLVKEYSTFNDHYGKGTCVDHAIREAKHEQRRLGESNLEFVVVKITSRRRMRPNRGQRENFYDTTFRAMEQLQFGCCRDLPDDVEEVVWSSLQAERAVESFPELKNSYRDGGGMFFPPSPPAPPQLGSSFESP